MKIYAGASHTALSLVALLPAMVQARGAASHFRRQQAQQDDPLGHASSQALKDKERRQKNIDLIHAHNKQQQHGRRGLKLKKGKSNRNGESNRKAKTMKTDVIIGGVGYAGAKLGEVLDQTDDVKFIILEASDRIGGRMYNIPFGAGDDKYSIELGAQWIDGIAGSPSWDLAVESGLLGSFDDFSFEVYAENGDRNFTEEFFEEGSECLAVDTAFNTANTVAVDCLQLNEGDFVEDPEFCNLIADDGDFVPELNDDTSREMAFDRASDFRIPDRPTPSLARTCDAFYEDFEHGLEPYEISTNNSVPAYAYIDFGDGDYFVNDTRGFQWLPRFLCGKYLKTSVNTLDEITFDDERLKMNHKITKVMWDPKGKKPVEVEGYFTERVDNVPGKPVLFPCKKGKENQFKIKGKEFVSTFAATVLKESIKLEIDGISLEDSIDIAPRFVPPLTENIEGIDVLLNYRAGIYNKAFFQFPTKFWTDTNYLVSAYSEGPFTGDFAPLWSNRARDGLDPDSNILHLYTYGNRGFKLDEMLEDDAIEELLPVLNDMFKANITSLYGGPLTKEDILDFYMTRWSIDPLFHGGYDADHINVTQTDRNTFRKRYGNLVLSGSYSCDRHPGWTHGGLLAGERTGIFLLKERYGYDELDTNNICDDGTGRTFSPTYSPTNMD
eukprot:CAMPEP_0201645992 /NCGR_PEP_ID=MMETSP0493-20130528/33143_1 /ASSEMBLY_ACC=CAM_ASM_000838 /TAXON_ID=420259 /ORGANISM="Thalassiosira gravida, Strain GMp14c1" /LENGTH=666 /DNA_ID=CAMNT_0048121057 /DNA_START=344 /DNA_END=2344 /DNA_ORIENTATION=-